MVGVVRASAVLLRWMLLCAMVWGLSNGGAHAASDEPGAYGRKRVEVFELSADELARFARFVPAKTDNPASIYARTQDWIGKELNLSTSGNPYTIAIKVVGVAVEAGDAKAYFRPGWSFDGGTRFTVVKEVAQPDAQAGELVQRTLASTPISLKDDRTMAPYIGFSGASNLNVNSITVEVWSGLPTSSGASLLGAWSPLLVGLVFLGLFLWWRR